MKLLMGNTHIPVAHRDEKTDAVTWTYDKAPKGGTVTAVEFPDDTGLIEAFQTVTLPGGIYSIHFKDGDAPEWISCPDSPGLEALLVEHFARTNPGHSVKIRKETT